MAPAARKMHAKFAALGSRFRADGSSGFRRALSGFTLLELMLVLAIIGMLAAMAIPKLNDVFERQKLRGAANNMRLAWDRARLEAMRAGQSQVFTCELGTGNYTIKPLVLQSDISSAGVGATLLVGGDLAETQAGGLLGGADTSESQQQQLEDEVIFVACNVAGSLRAMSIAQESQMLGMSDVNTQSVNQSVIFYPDGSTSTAEVRLQNKRGDVRGVQMRGLTGHTRTVDVSTVPTGEEVES